MLDRGLNIDSFLFFEEKNKCFELKAGQIYFWDLIRLNVYHNIDRDNNSKAKVKTKRKAISLNLFYRIIKLIKNSCVLLFFLFFKKCDDFYFTASRNKLNETKFFDRNLEDIIIKSNRKSIIFENFQNDLKKTQYKNAIFNPVDLIFKIFSKFFKNNDYSAILKLIKKEYPNSTFTNKNINEIVNKYKFELFFYSILFKLKKPKIIFLTQNGIQKGLFFVAKKNGIPLVEVQHGLINKNHVAYNYNKNITYNSDQIYLPTYFFVFSEFWKREVYYPVNRILEMGNSFLNNFNGTTLVKDGLLVISADIYAENLKKIVIDLVNQNYTKPIYFKLHPNQYIDKDYFIEEFSSFKNIYVFSSEKRIDELLKSSKATLVINSTVLYETLHCKNIGIIYKKQSYKEHNNIFNNPNIYLVNNAAQLKEAINKSFIEDTLINEVFFKDFDHSLFEQFITDLNL